MFSVYVILSVLLSTLLGTFLAGWLYFRLETRKLKIETARNLFGNRHNIRGNEFKKALNESMIVFADSEDVSAARRNLLTVASTPEHARRAGEADKALVKFLQAICKNLNIENENQTDWDYLTFFSNSS